MKPIILGQSVKGVTVDASTVQDCRTTKINQLKQDLSDFQSVNK